MEILIALIAVGVAIVTFIRLNTLAGKVEFLQKHIWSLERRLEQAPKAPFEVQKDQKREMPPISTKASALKSAEPSRKPDPVNEPTHQKPTDKKPWSQSPPKSVKPTKPKKSLEELIGAQWSVWVGGVALLFGAIFLLRYSIEAGVFTPAMRIAMAGVLGLVLLGVGEWLHRSDLKSFAKGRGVALAQGISNKAYIPTLLTAIGIFTLYGAVYAAYALYGFIGPLSAFGLLGVVSLGALALSFRHGPVLAAIGLAGSLLTPLLVQTVTPNVYMLYGYLLIISAASLFVARMRGWGWLNLATLFGWLMWSGISLEAGHSVSTAPIWFVFLGLGFLLSCYIASRASGMSLQKMTLKTAEYNALTATMWASIAALFIFLINVDGFGESWRYFAGILSGAVLMAASWVFKKQIWYVLVSVFLVFCLIIATDGLRPMTETLLTIGLFSGGLVAFSIFRIFKSSDVAIHSLSVIWAGLSTAYPLMTMLLLYGENFKDNNILFASSFSMLAVVFSTLAIYLRGDEEGVGLPARFYAVGAGIAYFFAVIIGFEGHAETLGLMIGIVLATLAAWQLGAFMPRIMAIAFAFISVAHSLFIRIADNNDVGGRLILNELWLYFALPSAMCAGAAWALSRRKDDIWSEGIKALSLTFAALFIIFQIRHIMNGGNVLAGRLGFDELALQVLTGLSFTLGATRLSAHPWNPKGDLYTQLLPTLAMVVSSVSLFIFVVGVCFAKSPLFNAAEVVKGNLALNSLTLGYLLPAALIAFIALKLRGRRPETYIQILGSLSLLSIILFITGMIRFGFSGANISILNTPPEGLELYAISAAWLLFGIALLVVGIKKDRLDLRLGSAILIILTVLKAFLIDMAELEGVLRALSFVVLGLILIIIGRSYQKILFSNSNSQKPSPQEEAVL